VEQQAIGSHGRLTSVNGAEPLGAPRTNSVESAGTVIPVNRSLSPPTATADAILHLLATRGFVTRAELQALGCTQHDLTELRPVPGTEDLFELQKGAERTTPGEGTDPLLEALDRHCGEEFDKEQQQSQLVELELWEALAVCTALGGRHGALIVRTYNRQAAQGDRFPPAL